MNKLNKNIKIIIGIILILAIILLITIYNIAKENEDFELENFEEEFLNENQESITEEQNIVGKTKVVEEKQIAIHITGEVKRKGLIYLEEGARIMDAIEKAGGATQNANLDNINLAYILQDGQKVYIPNKNEKIETKEYITENSGENVVIGEQNETKNMKGASDKVNINTANQTELETLPGIGPSLAQRIIEYRETNGNFKKKEDIQQVKGIGNSKYANIKEYISI